jgi:hypothetical protein
MHTFLAKPKNHLVSMMLHIHCCELVSTETLAV